jgi:ribosomal protein S12
MYSFPLKKAIVEKWFNWKPKKPNSSLSKVVRLRIKFNTFRSSLLSQLYSFQSLKYKTIYALIPGETNNTIFLREYNQVYIIPKGKASLVNVNYSVLRGMKDTPVVYNRKTSKSKYGLKAFSKNKFKSLNCNCFKCNFS